MTQPKTLDNYTPESKSGPKPIYPWKEWLDLPPKGKRVIPKVGRWKRMTAGTHFECSRDSMADMLRRNARRLGYKITVHKEEEDVVVFRRMERRSPANKSTKKKVKKT